MIWPGARMHIPTDPPEHVFNVEDDDPYAYSDQEYEEWRDRQMEQDDYDY